MFELETKDKVIDGRTVWVTQFPVEVQSRILPRIMKMLAPTLTRIEGIESRSDVKQFGPAIAQLFEHLEPDEAWQLQLALVAGTEVEIEMENKLKLLNSQAVNRAFGPNLLAFWEVVLFAAEVNFGPLFERVSSVASALLAARKVPSPSTPPGSTNPSSGQPGSSSSIAA